MADGSVGMSGRSFDAFVSSQRPFNDYDLTAKIQEKYWRARQKFLAKIEKKEDSCIVLSDSKLDAKLDLYRSIDKSCASLTKILENYQNCLFVYSNEENSLGRLLKECSKHDKTNAGKIMAITGKSLTQSSHERIRLYMPLLRLYREMETFHSMAVADTTETVEKLENRRSQYRASLLWMKDISERLDPDIYRQLDKFRRVQNQVRTDKKVFDGLQMDVVQKIDLLMASRCNLMNQVLASYQETLLDTFEKNYNNFRSIEALIKREDIYEYEFKTLKQLNPLQIIDRESSSTLIDEEGPDLMQNSPTDIVTENKDSNNNKNDGDCNEPLIEIALDGREEFEQVEEEVQDSGNILEELETLFGGEPICSNEAQLNALSNESRANKKNSDSQLKPNPNADLLSMDADEQIANLLGPKELNELLNFDRNDDSSLI